VPQYSSTRLKITVLTQP